MLNPRCAGDDMVSGWLDDAAGSGIPFRLTLQQAALVSAPAAGDIYVRSEEHTSELQSPLN